MSIFPRRSGARTNIGATVPPVRPLTEPGQAFIPGTGTALPVALPVAKFEGEEAGPQVVAPDPLWTSRWQNSKTPVGAKERPWVRGYKFFIAGVRYETWGPDPLFRIDFMWKNHREGYYNIPAAVFEDFKHLTGSVGEWFHNFILVENWKPGMGARYPSIKL